MSLQLYFKRAKLFLRDTEGKSERFVAGVGGPVKTPDWVKDTLGYMHGVKDGSIVDLTPPTLPVAKAELIAEVEPETTKDEAGATKDEAEADAESGGEKPAKPAFGGTASRMPKGVVTSAAVKRT